jgi:hypothetical protein
MAELPTTKSWYLSKTFWINLVALASVAIPSVQAYVAANPEFYTGIFAFVNLVLRLVTKDKLTID